MSFNCHQDHFLRLYGIHSQDGEIAHTACLGFGLERIVTRACGIWMPRRTAAMSCIRLSAPGRLFMWRKPAVYGPLLV